jgi:hypothetical protein
MVAHTYNPSYWVGGNRRILIQGQVRQKLVRCYLKNKPIKIKNTGGMAQVVEHFPSKLHNHLSK